MTRPDHTRPSLIWPLAGFALLAVLIWVTNTTSPAFALFRIALAGALLLVLAPYSYGTAPEGPPPWRGWNGQRSLDFAVALGLWFAALMLVVQADELMRAPVGWILGAVVGGAIFGGLSALVFRSIWAPMIDLAALDPTRPRMASPGARLWHLMRPGLVFFAVPGLLFAGRITPLDIWLYLFVAVVIVARMPSAFPAPGEAEGGWRLRPRGAAGWLRLGLFVLAFLLLVLRTLAPPFF